MMCRMLCKKSPKIVRLLPEILANIKVPFYAAASGIHTRAVYRLDWAGRTENGRLEDGQYDKICTFVG